MSRSVGVLFAHVFLLESVTMSILTFHAVRAFADCENTVYDEMLTAFAGLRAQENRLRQFEAQMAAEDVSEELMARWEALAVT
jgi:hypothetical protein